MQLRVLDLILFGDITVNFPTNCYFTNFDILHPNNVPIQPNGSDCGLYVMKFMETSHEMLLPTHQVIYISFEYNHEKWNKT